MHQSKVENPFVSIKALECRIMEHVLCVWYETNLVNTKALNWCPPSCGILKINVDAAILIDSTMIAVIA